MAKIKIAIISEISNENEILPVSYELTSKVKELTSKYNEEDKEIQILIVGELKDEEKVFKEFSYCGADRIFYIKFNEKNLKLRKISHIISNILKEEQTDIALIGATIKGRELAPLMATELQTGLTADCTDIKIENDKLEATRPTYGGKLEATILCKSKPETASVRAGVFKVNKNLENKLAKIEKRELILENNSDFVTEILSFVPKETNPENEIKDIVLVGGKGLKTVENFDKLKLISKILNVSTGATRAAVELGIAEKELQIGQTGKTIHAKLYIGFGVSGKIQHFVGIKSCDTIIAINKDKEAPIIKNADIGIIGDAVEVIEQLLKKLQK